MSQDLEQVIPIKPVQKTGHEQEKGEKLDINEDQKVNRQLESGLVEYSNERAPETYQKKKYLNQLLRQTYYHKLTTPAWAKYFNSTSWNSNVLKWRYWDQLKDFVTGNDQEIIEIRTAPVASTEIMETVNEPSDTISSIEVDNFPEEDNIADEETVVPSHSSTQKLSVNEDQQSNLASVPDKLIPEPESIPEGQGEIIKNETPILKKAPETTKKEPAFSQLPDPEKVTDTDKNTTISNEPVLSNSVVINDSRPFVQRKGAIQWPVSGGRVTDGYGRRSNAEARGLRPQNFGIDMICPSGEIVKSVHQGTVLMAKRQSPYDFIVTVKHGEFTTAYYYLINVYVQPGDSVKSGQALGQLRTSVAEADFHFEIWKNQDRVNPELWLRKK